MFRQIRASGGGGVASVPIYLPSTTATKAGVYAPNLVVSGYAGALYRIVRASDSATLDVMPATSNGWPDYAAIDTWAAGSAVTIDIAYNQLGGLVHLTQTTAANRPILDKLASYSGLRAFAMAPNVGNTVWGRFNIPAALALNRNDFGVHLVIDPKASYESRAYLTFDDSVSADYFVLFHNGTTNICAVNGSAVVRAPTRFKSKLQAFGISSGANTKIYKDGLITTGTGQSAQLMALGGRTGTSIADSAFTAQHNYFSMVFFSTAPTDADMAAMDKWAASVYPIATGATKRAVISGSSLITSWGSSANYTMPTQMMLDASWEMVCIGFGGRSLSTEYTNRDTIDFPNYDPTKLKNVLVIDAPSNDIQSPSYTSLSNAIASVDTIFNTITVPFVAAAKTKGFAVVVPTTIGRGTFNTGNFKLQALERYNQTVLDNALRYGYTVSDRYGDPRLRNPLDTTYYTSDQTHLTNVGYGVQAVIDKAAILQAS